VQSGPLKGLGQRDIDGNRLILLYGISLR